LRENHNKTQGILREGVYEYLKSKDKNIGTYSNFNKYVKKKGLKPERRRICH